MLSGTPRRRGLGAAASSGLVLLSATLWSTEGLLITRLFERGFSPTEVVYYCFLIGFVLLFGALLLFGRRFLIVPWRDVPALMALGVIGGGLSFVLYATAIDLAGAGVAIVLSYTAPAWVSLFAWPFLGERIGRRQALAVVTALVGCGLIAQMTDPAALQTNLPGVLIGLASGVANGASVVLGKWLLNKHHPLTVTVFTMGVGTLSVMPLVPVPFGFDFAPDAWPWLAVFVLGPNLLAPLAFNLGLRVLRAGLATLLGMWEIVIALLISVLVLSETLDLIRAIGAALVVGSVLIVGHDEPRNPAAPPVGSGRAG